MTSFPDNPQGYIEKIITGDRTVLSRAITLVESSNAEHRDLSAEIVNGCIAHTGNSIRIGITGVPGVGKSTMIDVFGSMLANEGKKVAVLAIDPSSSLSKGSILGDKTRMEELSTKENVFIRPTASSGKLGGVASNTRETMLLCEAAGFDVIIVETVGVGQSETTVRSMVDFFLLLMLSGAGDELQGIKRGIMETADLITITKADRDNINKAKQAKSEYSMALDLFPPSPSGWKPRVTTCSATEQTGIQEIWDVIEEFSSQTKISGWFEKNRKEQAIEWFHKGLHTELLRTLDIDKSLKGEIEKAEIDIEKGVLSSYTAARSLAKKFSQKSF